MSEERKLVAEVDKKAFEEITKDQPHQELDERKVIEWFSETFEAMMKKPFRPQRHQIFISNNETFLLIQGKKFLVRGGAVIQLPRTLNGKHKREQDRLIDEFAQDDSMMDCQAFATRNEAKRAAAYNRKHRICPKENQRLPVRVYGVDVILVATKRLFGDLEVSS